MVCQKCGAELLEDDVFCGECGTKVEKKEETSKKRFCHSCGAELLEDDIFCGECGTKVLGASEEKKEIEETPKHVDINPDAHKEKKDLYRLTINREKSFVGCLASLKIKIDDKEVGKIKNGATLFTSVPEGSHTIFVNNQEIATLNITADTSVEVAFSGPNMFTLQNIEVGGVTQNIVENRNSKKGISASTKSCWTAVILFPVISLILAYTVQLIVHPIAYGFLIGYAIINIVGLKKYEKTQETQSLITQNIIIIAIAIGEAILATFMTV